MPMIRPLALIIHPSDAPLTGISKLAEARDCSVHVSRSVDEAERVLAAFPIEQQKIIFADLAVCHGAGWNGYRTAARKVRAFSVDLLRSVAFARSLRAVRPSQQSFHARQ